jgi:hypothetical protein
MKAEPTQARLRELLVYDAETGLTRMRCKQAQESL